MNLVFAGTPEFAAAVLEGLLAARYHIAAVYTQPDRPAGRGRRTTASAVKQLALRHGVEVRQPASLKDPAAVDALAALRPDAMIVAAYGLILPPTVLGVPLHGCINVHASLLPRWRGAAPIQRAILAGDRETGVCIMRMERGLDTGPVLAERRCAIGPDDTSGTLHERLARLGGDALLATLPLIRSDTVTETPQDDRLATYAHRIDKSEARIDWRGAAVAIDRRIRAFNPAPGAWTTRVRRESAAGPGTRLRILAARPAAALPAAPAPGEIVINDGRELRVACGEGSLTLLAVQPAGRKPMSAADFLNARGPSVGDRLE